MLCPSRKGETGTVNINRILQERLNPHRAAKKEITTQGRILREGDKVMQIKNNYDIRWHTDDKTGEGVFNGDIGTLLAIDFKDGVMTILFDDRKAVYPLESAMELEHAYAVTVHKSQGNEFNCVIMPVFNVIEQLSYRNLLYTAVTRAKSLMIIAGRGSDVKRMIDNNKKTRRFSALRYLLEDE
ncbi:ATP-dependent RecD-like DNA helicase [bioreactor metagenome]|uniref:ATP-dependent RecD-like DNA helicase n=1 Tax=bioreactor metagenome TaxID=1076179 RepID=A0A645HXA3_9ZZZZ